MAAAATLLLHLLRRAFNASCLSRATIPVRFGALPVMFGTREHPLALRPTQLAVLLKEDFCTALRQLKAVEYDGNTLQGRNQDPSRLKWPVHIRADNSTADMSMILLLFVQDGQKQNEESLHVSQQAQITPQQPSQNVKQYKRLPRVRQFLPKPGQSEKQKMMNEDAGQKLAHVQEKQVQQHHNFLQNQLLQEQKEQLAQQNQKQRVHEVQHRQMQSLSQRLSDQYCSNVNNILEKSVPQYTTRQLPVYLNPTSSEIFNKNYNQQELLEKQQSDIQLNTSLPQNSLLPASEVQPKKAKRIQVRPLNQMLDPNTVKKVQLSQQIQPTENNIEKSEQQFHQQSRHKQQISIVNREESIEKTNVSKPSRQLTVKNKEPTNMLQLHQQKELPIQKSGQFTEFAKKLGLNIVEDNTLFTLEDRERSTLEETVVRIQLPNLNKQQLPEVNVQSQLGKETNTQNSFNNNEVNLNRVTLTEGQADQNSVLSLRVNQNHMSKRVEINRQQEVSGGQQTAPLETCDAQDKDPGVTGQLSNKSLNPEAMSEFIDFTQLQNLKSWIVEMGPNRNSINRQCKPALKGSGSTCGKGKEIETDVLFQKELNNLSPTVQNEPVSRHIMLESSVIQVPQNKEYMFENAVGSDQECSANMDPQLHFVSPSIVQSVNDSAHIQTTGVASARVLCAKATTSCTPVVVGVRGRIETEQESHTQKTYVHAESHIPHVPRTIHQTTVSSKSSSVNSRPLGSRVVEVNLTNQSVVGNNPLVAVVAPRAAPRWRFGTGSAPQQDVFQPSIRRKQVLIQSYNEELEKNKSLEEIDSKKDTTETQRNNQIQPYNEELEKNKSLEEIDSQKDTTEAQRNNQIQPYNEELEKNKSLKEIGIQEDTTEVQIINNQNLGEQLDSDIVIIKEKLWSLPESWGDCQYQDDKSQLHQVLSGEASETNLLPDVILTYSSVCVKEKGLKDEVLDANEFQGACSNNLSSKNVVKDDVLGSSPNEKQNKSVHNDSESLNLVEADSSKTSEQRSESQVSNTTDSSNNGQMIAVLPKLSELQALDKDSVKQLKNRNRKNSNPKKRTKNIVMTSFDSENKDPAKSSPKVYKTAEHNRITKSVSKPSISDMKIKIKPIVVLHKLPMSVFHIFNPANKRPSTTEVVSVVRDLLKKIEVGKINKSGFGKSVEDPQKNVSNNISENGNKTAKQGKQKRKQNSSANNRDGKRRRSSNGGDGSHNRQGGAENCENSLMEEVETECSTTAASEDEFSPSIFHSGKTTICKTPPLCIYCGDFGPGGEIWVKCTKCLGWAHADCSGAVKSKFICDYCTLWRS